MTAVVVAPVDAVAVAVAVAEADADPVAVAGVEVVAADAPPPNVRRMLVNSPTDWSMPLQASDTTLTSG